MRNQPYYFEIKDLITQFISAFNEVTINRYNKSRAIVDKIRVKYLYAPKQRVLNDLINKSQHVTLPAIAVSVTGIEKDEERVFNKIYGSYESNITSPDQRTSKHLPAPVPINISMNMSIMTKYQTDMDQIISNFIPYTNPYIVISWKVPSTFVSQVTEIRTEVNWSGTMALDYPTELSPDQPARVTADTTFTIKGWLFPEKSMDDGQNILYVNTNLTPVTGFEYI